MSSTVEKEFSCQFNGGCGSSFNSETDYLRHVVKHLRIQGTTATEILNGFREQSKNLTEERFAFDCLIPRQILSLYNRENAYIALSDFTVTTDLEQNSTINNQLPPVCSPYCSKKLFSQDQHFSSFPVHELVLNRFQAEEDDLIPPNQKLKTASKSKAHSCISPSDPSKSLPSPKILWSKILENFPSVADNMDAQEIIEAATKSCSKAFSEPEHTTSPILRGNYFFVEASPPINWEAPGQTMKPCFTSEETVKKNLYSPRKCLLTPSLETCAPLKRGGKDMRRPYQNFNPSKHCAKNMHLKSADLLERVTSEHHLETKIAISKNKKMSACTGKATSSERMLHKKYVGTPGPKFIKNIRYNNLKRKLTQQENEHYSSDYILEEGLKKKRAVGVTYLKPYVCPVPKCGKSYKNANGIKYHAKYGHSPPQQFPCLCGKLYSSMHSLLAHKKTHSTDSECSDSSSFQYHCSSDSDRSVSDECFRECNAKKTYFSRN